MIKLAQPWIDEKEHEAVSKVLDSGYLTDGPVTRDFEKAVCDYTGVSHAVATTSCATALDLALRAVGVQPGDEVIIPDYTHPATIDVVKVIGATPILVPVDKDTYNVTPEQIKAALSEKTTCVMPVSLFGQPLDIKAIRDVLPKGVFIVEDAACSIGSTYDGVQTGMLADITCFSFHPRKVITTGEGGMAVTNNEEYANIMKSMKHFGANGVIEGTRIVKFDKIGMNYKLSNIQSAVGVEQMKKLNKIVAFRREKAAYYDSLLKDTAIQAPIVPEKARHIYQTYCVLLPAGVDRNKVITLMKEKEIETQVGSYCLHVQEFFKDETSVGDLAISKEVYDRALALPLQRSITKEEQETVVSTLLSVLSDLE